MRLPLEFFLKDISKCASLVFDSIRNHTENTWIAGSYAAMRLKPKSMQYNDIDLFFKDHETFEAIDKIFVANNSFEEIFRCPKGELVSFKPKVEGKKVQLVGKYFSPTPEDCIDNFDFNICCAAIHRDNIVTTEECMKDLSKEVLTLNKITYPVSSLRRLIKYGKKGITIHPETYLKIVEAINSMEINDDNLIYYID